MKTHHHRRKKSLHIILLLVVLMLIIVGASGVVWYVRDYQNPILQCGSLRYTLPESFASLPNPKSVRNLNRWGCQQSATHCLCAKVDPHTDTGMILSITEADASTLQAPQNDPYAQKEYLQQLAAAMMISSQMSTTSKVRTAITDFYSTIQNNPGVIMTSTYTTPKGMYQGRDVFMAHNSKIYSISYQTSATIFSSFWPDIESSLNSIRFR